MSLEEIARATRVSSGYLRALEEDDFASLPVPVFTRGFIRAYCQTLGDAPEPALALYDARADPTPAVAEPPVAPSRPASTRMTTASEAALKNRGPLLVSFVLLVVLGIALFAVTLVLQSGRERGAERTAAAPAPIAATPSTSVSPPSTPEAAPAAAPAPPPPAPAATTPPVSTPAAPPATSAPVPSAGGGGHRLVARTTEPTWMRVHTEDGRVSEETIPAGQVREWHSTGPFRITVGNAGGVTLELNGRMLPPLGARGAVVPNLVVPAERP